MPTGTISSQLASRLSPIRSGGQAVRWIAALAVLSILEASARWIEQGHPPRITTTEFQSIFLWSILIFPLMEEVTFRWLPLAFVKHMLHTSFSVLAISMAAASALWVSLHYIQDSNQHDIWSIPTDVALAVFLIKLSLSKRLIVVFAVFPIHALYNLWSFSFGWTTWLLGL